MSTKKNQAGHKVITIRAISGLSGDILLTGLALMNGYGQQQLDRVVASIGLPALNGCAKIEKRFINGVAGWGMAVALSHEHAHRTVEDIRLIIEASSLPDEAKRLALKTFKLLAEAEGEVHGVPAGEVTFHEVGALDSILDICAVCSLFVGLEPCTLVCSPLPLADGSVNCVHGCLPSPAPAVLKMLQSIPVTSYTGSGETVTPTALALLKSLGVVFGPWPDMVVEQTALVYGSKVFDHAPNGVVWARGIARG